MRLLACAIVLLVCVAADTKPPTYPAFSTTLTQTTWMKGVPTNSTYTYTQYFSESQQAVTVAGIDTADAKNGTYITLAKQGTTILIMPFFNRTVCTELPFDQPPAGVAIDPRSRNTGTATMDGKQCNVWEYHDLIGGPRQLAWTEVGTDVLVKQMEVQRNMISTVVYTNFIKGEPPATVFEIPQGMPCLNLDTPSAMEQFGRDAITAPFLATLGNKFVNDPSRIAEINKKATTWRAGPSKRFDGQTLREAQRLLGWNGGAATLPKAIRARSLAADIPAEFDARTQWSNCTTIQSVRNQGQCGSCWAFAAVESLADRICINSGGAEQPVLAPQWLVSCDDTNMGCGGGYLDFAWWYIEKYGVVTEACDPYQADTLPCPSSCSGGAAMKKYQVSDAYTPGTTVEEIQAEIVAHGPVEVAFWVFEDFMSYTTGVYQHTGGQLAGGHAVKIIGWGTDGDTPYWTVANSWGNAWGENGFFKILRGVDECGIEQRACSGTPII